MSKLKTLSLSYCEVDKFPKSFFALTALESLDLSDGSLPDSVPDGFGKLSSLKELRVNDTHWRKHKKKLGQLLPNCKITG